MLFTYSVFWKTLTLLVFTWIVYLFLGYQFTIITLLALLVARSYQNSNYLV